MGSSHKSKHVVSLLKKISNYKGNIIYRINMPSGRLIGKYSQKYQKKIMPKFKCKTNLDSGLRKTYNWLSKNYEKIK